MKSKNDGMVSMENQFEENNRIVAERKEKLKKIKESYGELYPNKYKPSARAKTIIDEYDSIDRDDLEKKKEPGENNILCSKGFYRENSALFE